MATPLHLMATTQQPTSSEPKPDPKPPKPRGRKPGKSSGSGGPKKTPQRGMGVAQLERILSEKDQQQQNQPGQPLTGVPVQAQPSLAHFGVPAHRAQRPSAFRVVAGSVGPTEELPSMPNLLLDQDGYYLDHSFKKKRVIGDELGFIKGRDKSYLDHHQILAPVNVSNYYGLDLNMGGAFSGYIPGNEAMAIHRKGSVTMEFFPGKSDTIYEEEAQGRNSRCSSSSIITMEDLSLRIGCPDSSFSSSPSPSSSLSSSPSSSNFIDLSLKLSY